MGDGVQAFTPTFQLQQLFMQFLQALNAPDDMAMFSRTEGKSHTVVMYFSPAAKDVAVAAGATPCAKPSINGLGLLVGNARAWGALFPGERPGPKPFSNAR